MAVFYPMVRRLAAPYRWLNAAGDTMGIPVSLLSATGDEIASNLLLTVNKATSGDAYGYHVTVTDTSSPGGLYPFAAKVGSNYEFLVDEFGNIIRNLASGEGDKIGTPASNDFGWRDITAPMELRGTGANDPTFTRNLGGGPFAGYKFIINSEGWFYYHIPHDIVPSSDIHFHVHWKSDGTDITNTVKWQWTYSHAKGFGQEAMNMTGTTVTAEQVSAGQWYPMVTETAAVTISNLTEPDGILEVHMKRITNGGTDVTDGIYVTTADVHYQSTSQATKNKAPGFYT